MKRLLITGARGFIGRHCLMPAVDSGFEVHALASSSQIPYDLGQADIKWHIANLLEGNAAQQVLGQIRPTHLLHTAWVTAHDTYWTSPENFRWLAAGTRLVEAFAANGGRRFVSVGSCAEYDWSYGYLSEGLSGENPSTLYGATKLAHHLMLQAAGRQLGFSTATGRIFFAYGPHENPKRIIPSACRQLRSGDEVQCSSGQFWRDFMHVSDVARGLVVLLNNDLEGACNICSGTPSLLADVVRTLGRISGNPDGIRFGSLPNRAGDPPMLVGDNALLRSIGWSQELSLEEGLHRTFMWWKERAA